MSEIRLNLPDVDFSHDDETREARHELLASFLGAYVDGELPPETRSQIDAHLTGCARCRRELDMHRAVRARLGQESVPAASSALRDRIAAGIKQAEPPTFPVEISHQASDDNRPRITKRSWIVAGTLAVAIAGVLLVTEPWSVRHVAAAPIASVDRVPLFASILKDYRAVSAGETPGRARDLVAVRSAVPFAFAPLSDGSLRLLAAWTTNISDEPVAVLAYRWNNRQILQYFFTDQLLFQSPAIRDLVAQQRAASATDGVRGLLLWAEPEYGTMLVGDVSPDELAKVRDAGRAR